MQEETCVNTIEKGDTMAYEKLFSKGKIGSLELRNRIVMPPMGTTLASFTGEAGEEIIRYYEERAKGGCGLIITEIARVDDETGIGMPGQISVSSGKYVRNLVKLVDAVHKHDSKIFIQLHHPGREVSKALLGGRQPVAPSPIPCGVVKEMPKELTTKECEELIKKFITGANIAKMAGFDGVELHGAHGYLINQFLSPYTNKRTDKFGGDYFKRLNFISGIITGIKFTCGANFPISVRLSCDEFVEGGLKIDEAVKIARSLESFGVHAINVSAGTYESGYAVIEPQGLPEGWKKHLATEVRKHVKIPVIAVNNIKQPATAERFLEEGVCDFVAIGRGLLADPGWGEKARTGQDTKIRKCLGCMHCFRVINMLRSVECTVNPCLGREYLFNEDTLRVNGGGKSVAVIGGGPAGMHAAAVLGKRGYQVTLFDKNEALGGTMLLAEKPPHKEMIGELIKTQAEELADAGVEVRLGTEATAESIKAMNPYGVILAAGGLPIVPKIPGIDKAHVCTAEQIVRGEISLSGKKAVVIGGGITGLETAEILAAENTVTLVEMMKEVGPTLYISLKALMLRRLAGAGATILTGQRLTEIGDTAVTLTGTATGYTKELEADAVVLALGVRANNALAEEFEAAFDKVVRVGDVSKPGQISDALREANDKAHIF
jgi:2,4-dienoyl-CoA reductase-like NADH-dependent reductase (Old Yellow Enzyme family)